MSRLLDPAVVRFARRSTDHGTPARTPFVCFSHLRWGFVWQRPQHLMTRIARTHPVYFVEEPNFDEEARTSRLEATVDHNVTILTPVLPASLYHQAGFRDENNIATRNLLRCYFHDKLATPEVVAWYYSPMALGALPDNLIARVTVYDAMDELANFRHAPVEIRDRERMLMQAADLVFSGGPSLHESRKYRHPRAFCFPSGVDAAHFQRVETVPEDITTLRSPVIGFYGVLDERIDFELVGGIADGRPEWSIVMIGPVVKIDESELARRPNIHYLGPRTYDQLPSCLAQFDAALLPFADNEATRFISPTKTLEYLAGGKPVVSTHIRDVVELYGDVVELAATPADFIAAIERLWHESAEDRGRRKQLVNAVLAEHDWDLIASHMQCLVDDVLLGRSTFTTVLRNALSSASSGMSTSVPGRAS